jgi:hypothetical protein
MVRNFQRSGGKVSVFAERSDLSGLNTEILPPPHSRPSQDKSAEEPALAEIISLAPDATHIEFENKNGHTLANVTSVHNGQTLVIHLLNYGQAPVGELRIKLVLGQALQKLAGRKPILFSPDAKSPAFCHFQWHDSTLELTLASIDTYSIVVLQ